MADGLTHEESGRAAIAEKMKAAYYQGVTMPTVGKDNGLKVGSFATTERDDPSWAKLVEQVPYDEMINVVYNGFHLTQPAPTIGLPGTSDENGPQGFTATLLGGSSGMGSFNRLGVVWSGAHYGLMTEVLTNEWGKKGAAITDCSVMAKYMDYRLGVLAGQDLWDGYSREMATLDGLDNDPAIVTAVQRAFTNICYSISHSHAMNVGNATIITITPWWHTAIMIVACGCTLAALVFAVLAFLGAKKAKAEVTE